MRMTGGEYIAEFLARLGSDRVFLLTGGACAFMVDAVARHPRLSYTCFHHEQAAAMAADAVWRVSGRVGVTMATSGPGATNLITGIACSYFDSIPSLHLTGQVNQRESSAFQGAAVRQSGFQQTNIVEMVRPITKYAVMVRSARELPAELGKAYTIATSARMGPVLVDVPIDIQQEEVEPSFDPILTPPLPAERSSDVSGAVASTLASAQRPIVLWGAGIGLAGVQEEVSRWLKDKALPFVSSWGGLSYFDHDQPGFLGQIGVYGNRGANFVLQNADAVLVLGSRLDNRQRSGNPRNFAVGAAVHVLDCDIEELRKYRKDHYRTSQIDFRLLPAVLRETEVAPANSEWQAYVAEMKSRYFHPESDASGSRPNRLCPYEVVRRINAVIAEDAIVAVDTGACLCWVFQSFKVKNHNLFTAGGNSPMGYALPAAIGAKLVAPDRQVLAIVGDGGFQLNIQELQTLVRHQLNVAIIVMNNRSYGIIKQFQDSYLGRRHHASQDGYSAPDFRHVAEAYGLGYRRVESPDDLTGSLFSAGPIVIEVVLNEDTRIEPKLEMGRPINDQFPYLGAADYSAANRFVNYPRKEFPEQSPFTKNGGPR
jgi:acetolactate synthase-1/2/3 large subunit